MSRAIDWYRKTAVALSGTYNADGLVKGIGFYSLEKGQTRGERGASEGTILGGGCRKRGKKKKGDCENCNSYKS